MDLCGSVICIKVRFKFVKKSTEELVYAKSRKITICSSMLVIWSIIFDSVIWLGPFWSSE